MDAATSTGKTAGQELPWAVTMIGYTDMVVESLTEDSMQHRPANPGGGYFFSAAEQAMHIADTRWNILGWLDGNDYSERVFAGDYPGKDAAWQFREATLDEIKQSVKDSRAKLDEWLNRPAGELSHSTPGLDKAHQQRLEGMRAEGKDTAELEAKGPGNLANMILFTVAHEQSHRGVLQTILRMHGAEVVRLA
jgi:uncharacterized damage-inducible protein DinB